MWAACINKLSLLPYELRAEVPKFLKKAFNEAGVLNDDEIFIPIRPVALLGSCDTADYVDCPNMPEHHIELFQDGSGDDIGRWGEYYWFDFDVVWPNEEALQLRMVFNEGVADCNDGLWGAVWERNTEELIANILSTGDGEATVEVSSRRVADKYESHEVWIPNTFGCDDEYDPLPCSSVEYASNLNLEKVIGLAIRMCSVYRSEWFYENLGYDL